MADISPPTDDRTNPQVSMDSTLLQTQPTIEIPSNLLDGDVKIVSKEEWYIWNQDTHLWMPGTRDSFRALLDTKIAAFVSESRNRTGESTESPKVTETMESLADQVRQQLQDAWIRWLVMDLFKRTYEETKFNLDAQKTLIPCRTPSGADLVFDVETATTSVRTKEHQFSNVFAAQLPVFRLSMNQLPSIMFGEAMMFVNDMFARMMCEVEKPFGRQPRTRALQKFLGYCITGDIRFRKMLVLMCDDSIGYLLSNLLRLVMGTFYVHSDKALITNSADCYNYSKHLMAIKGKRATVITGLTSKDRINVEDIEELVRDDEILVRAPFCSGEALTPMTKLIICTNDVIKFSDERWMNKHLVVAAVRARFGPNYVKDDDVTGTYPIDLDLLSRFERSHELQSHLFAWLIDGAVACYQSETPGAFECSDSIEDKKLYLAGQNPLYK